MGDGELAVHALHARTDVHLSKSAMHSVIYLFEKQDKRARLAFGARFRRRMRKSCTHKKASPGKKPCKSRPQRGFQAHPQGWELRQLSASSS